MLVEALDAHYAWMLGEARSQTPGLRLPPGQLETAETLRLLRGMNQRLRNAGSRGSWLIVVEQEVVGLCGYKGPADAGGTVEIGYGIAPSRRNRGHATGAVRDMLAYAARDLSVSIVVAATSVDNLASQVVLKRNGFLPSGVTNDPDDGELVWWRNELH